MKYILSITIAIGATFTCAIILYPLLEFLVNKLLDVYYVNSNTNNPRFYNWVVLISISIWIFIATIIGGFICARMVKNKEIVCIGITIFISFIIIVLISKGQIFLGKPYELAILFLFLVGGFCSGAYLGILVKKRKRVIDSFSFLADNP